jgi:hypothetical protein
MSKKNSYAGVCYLCANYVAQGAGEVVRYKVKGQLTSLRCEPCSTRAKQAATIPTEAALNENAARITRQALRDSLLKLLTDEDMPADKVRPAQQWIEAKQRPVEALHRFKERLLEIRNEARDNRLNGRRAA